MELRHDDLTAKGQRTRQRILDAALKLFAEHGYECATMRDIADESGCSLGLAYRYFASKEAFVLALYDQILQKTAEYIETLPVGTMSERFSLVLSHTLVQIAPYREALSALFAGALRDNSEARLTGSNESHGQLMCAFGRLVIDATDRPRDDLVNSMATLLHGLHVLTMQFWLYDRTPQQQTTLRMVEFMSDALKLLRPMLLMPVVNKAIVRLADIMLMLLSGTRETDQPADQNTSSAEAAAPAHNGAGNQQLEDAREMVDNAEYDPRQSASNRASKPSMSYSNQYLQKP